MFGTAPPLPGSGEEGPQGGQGRGCTLKREGHGRRPWGL